MAENPRNSNVSDIAPSLLFSGDYSDDGCSTGWTEISYLNSSSDSVFEALSDGNNLQNVYERAAKRFEAAVGLSNVRSEVLKIKPVSTSYQLL